MFDTFDKIAFSIIFIVIITGVIIVALIIKNDMEPSNNSVICKNVQKLYKDDILFDNFYISCNDTTIEIGKELFTRIIENKNYKITYKNNGSIYSVEKVDDK